MGILGSAVKAAMWLGGGHMASSYIDDQAQKATNPWAKIGLGAASMAVTFKSFQGATKSVLGGAREFGRRGRIVDGATELPSWYHGANRAHRFVSNFGVRGAAKLVGGAVGSVAMGTPKFLGSPVTGAVEYGAAAVKSARGGPGSFFASLTSMHSPEAPVAALGLMAGGYAAVQNDRYSHQGPITVPSFWGKRQGPVNQQNFGGGISYGRSALSSPVVAGGQAAVTNRMLQKRRV